MRYLIHTGPGIGDIIQFLSMARAIKEEYPNSIVDFLMRGSVQISELNNQILECQDYVDNLYWYSSKALKHDVGLIVALRRKHYDFGIVRVGIVNGGQSLWVYRIMRLAGCKKIVGVGTDKVDIGVTIPERAHYLERNSLLLEAIGIKGRDDALSINKEKLANDWLETLEIPDNAMVIGMSLGTNSMLWHENGEIIVYDVKSWPIERWFELAEKLVREAFYVMLIGGNKERQEILNKKIKIPDSRKVIDLVGKTTIKQSLTIVNRCNLMVGAEGGMMHCASALGTKTLTIFGGSDYRIWNPGGIDSPMVNLFFDCAPCFCTSAGAHCKEHYCLLNISVGKLFTNILELFEREECSGE